MSNAARYTEDLEKEIQGPVIPVVCSGVHYLVKLAKFQKTTQFVPGQIGITA
jgi:hypothetical protein